MAIDALNSEKLNIGVGGKNQVIIRQGYYVKDGALKRQSMYFETGDTLHVEVKRGTAFNKAGIAGRTENNHLRGTVLANDSELIGVLKGIKQVLEERGVPYSTAPGESGCQQAKVRQKANEERKRLLQDWESDREDHVKRLKFLTYPKHEDVILQSKLTPCSCASCTLSKQDDFRSQKSGLEEIYETHNKMHGTSHQCKFLPKFHPELNPIERVWSRLKWYLRKYNDGKLATLQLLMKKGLDRENVSLTLIRKYCRLVTAYYIAYIDGKDIIQAESWIKKHRSHRGHSGTMDEKLYKLYFPYGVDNDEHINDDELALHDNMIEYINDNVTHDDELDTWLNMLDNYQRSGRII
jgi:hypothetical protein